MRVNALLVILAVLSIWACQTDPVQFDAAAGGQDTGGADTISAKDTEPGQDSIPGKDVAVGDDTESPSDTLPGDSIDDAEVVEPWDGNLFQDQKVLEFDLTIPAQDWKAALDGILVCPVDCSLPRQYLSATLVFHNPWTKEDETVENIGLRYRGNSAACLGMDPRVGFKVSFNENEAGRRFHNQKKLNFLGTEGDYAMMREVLAFESMKKWGLPGSKAGFALVSVNGEPKRLYPMIEESDDTPFIEEVLGEVEKGALFKVDGYCGQPGYDEYFEGIVPDDLTEKFELKAGTLPEAMNTTLIPFLECFSHADDAEFKTCFEAKADKEVFLKALAIDMAMPDQDGFWNGGKNHSLYFRKADNLATVILWDKDGSFRDNYCAEADMFDCIPPWLAELGRPAGLERLAAAYGPEIDQYIAEFATDFMSDAWAIARIEHWFTLLSPLAADDPDMKEHNMGWYWPESVSELRDGVLIRSEAILEQPNR